MLSITPLKDAQSASDYYEKDNYYAKEEAKQLSEWWGKGATKLNLSGVVEIDDFETTLKGKLPSGEQLGRVTKNGVQHRPGYDLTFSAPKSVSMMAEIAGDDRVTLAHKAAVKQTLQFLESKAVLTRQMQSGIIEYEPVDNLAVAMFHHNTSRALDPNLHTHCVALNLVQRPDGAWRSISSELMYDYKMTGGVYYRSVLAKNLQEIGYEVEKTSSDGTFEIKGISREQISLFSKRRQQIVAEMEKNGWQGAKAASVATLNTRQQKQEVEHDLLKNMWQKEAAEQGVNLGGIYQQSFQICKIKQTNALREAKNGVKHAIEHLSEREAVITNANLMREALAYTIGNAVPEDIQQEIYNLIKNKSLIKTNAQNYTTPQMIALEQSNLNLVKEAKGKTQAIASMDDILNSFEGKGLTKTQKDAINLILSTKDRAVCINGKPGTGKTYMLNVVKDVAKQQNYTIIGLSVTGKAVEQLQLKAKINSNTISQFINDTRLSKNNNFANKNLFVIDEASMLSSKQMQGLIKSINQVDPSSHMVFIGDKDQLSAVGAGKPFAQFLQNGVKSLEMNEIKRQKNQLIKQAVEATIDNDILLAFQNIGNSNIKEINDREERLEKISEYYLNMSDSVQSRTMVLTATNQDRAQISSLIRNGMTEQGKITKEEQSMTILVNKSLTQAQIRSIYHYDIGDAIRFNANFKRYQIKSGDYLTVQNVNFKKNQLTLESDTGAKIKCAMDGILLKKENTVEVYSQETRPLSVGDSIRWRRMIDKDKGLVTSKTAKIIELDNEKATLSYEAKDQKVETIELDLSAKSNQHWDYSYVATVHSAQGDDADYVIANMDSMQGKLNHQNWFYVTLSRAKQQPFLFVDDKEACANLVKSFTGEKLSALEALEQKRWYPANKKTEIIFNAVLNSSNLFSDSTPKALEQKKYYDLNKIMDNISLGGNNIITEMLGEANPKLSSKNELRFGNKGSVIVTTNLDKFGVWYDHEACQGGNLYQLVKEQKGFNDRETIEYLANYTHVQPEKNIEIKPKENKKIENPLSKDDIKSIQYAQYLFSNSQPIEGTLAETYLRNHRGITAQSLPKTLRFHPNIKDSTTGKYYPTLLAGIKNNNQIKAVQAIYLDEKSANKASIPVNKRTFGRIKYSNLLTLNDPPNAQKVLLCEGPETAMSLRDTFPNCEIKAALSVANFHKYELPEGKELILCLDNDGKESNSYESVRKALDVFKEKNYSVKIAIPEEVGQDFNDISREKGIAQVKYCIDNCITHESFFEKTTSAISNEKGRNISLNVSKSLFV